MDFSFINVSMSLNKNNGSIEDEQLIETLDKKIYNYYFK